MTPIHARIAEDGYYSKSYYIVCISVDPECHGGSGTTTHIWVVSLANLSGNALGKPVHCGLKVCVLIKKHIHCAQLENKSYHGNLAFLTT